MAGAAVATCVVVLAVFAVVSRGPLSTSNAVADIAQAAYALDPPPPSKWSYAESEIVVTQKVVRGSRLSRTGKAGSLVRVRQRRRAWLSVDEPGRVQTSELTKVSSASERGRVSPVKSYAIGAQSFSVTELSRLKAAPSLVVAAVDRAVAAAPPADRAATEWRVLVEPLRAFAPVLPSAVRAQMIREFAAIPGVRLAKDSPRGTTTFVLESNGLRETAVFDQRTASLLETRTVTTRAGAGPFAGAPAGTQLYAYRLRDLRTVSRVGATR